MRKHIAGTLMLVSLFFLNCTLESKNADKHPIPHQKITWDDFKGDIDPNSKFYAMTWWYVRYSYASPVFKNQRAWVDIKVSYGLKDNSWYKPEKISDQLLNHEQGHLNIAYLLALDLHNIYRKAVFSKTNYKSRIDAIYKNTEAKYLEMEKRYDVETNHMYNVRTQKLWDTFFEKEAVRLLKISESLNR